MSDEIKSVNISGAAAYDLTGTPKRGGKRNTKKKQDGGAAESIEQIRGVSSQINLVKGIESPSQIAATAASPNTKTWLQYPATAPVPPQINPVAARVPAATQSAAPTNQYAVPTALQGGAHTKQIKVELRKKESAKKVHLNPKKIEAQKTSKKHQTRKLRKVTLGIKSLHKRLTRAKKLHKEIKDMPIETLKEKLVKGGLIKSTSKAPESVLRQIAGDAAVVAKKAL